MDLKARIPPLFNENYDEQWGIINYTNKIVLDIGGSTGDTCDFFLRKGAIIGICVDKNEEYIRICRESRIKFNLPMLCICLSMDTPEIWACLINWFNPDVVKSDCEGCECHLLAIPNAVFSKVPEYIIEVHQDHVYNKLMEKCKDCNYNVQFIYQNPQGPKIIYLKKGK